MSIGNLKDQGNKGNNFPYQLRTLQLLGEINNGINALPGADYETRTTTYEAIATVGGQYTIGDIIVRYDVIDVPSGTVATTVWFNQTTQTTISAPAPANIQPYAGASSTATAFSNLVRDGALDLYIEVRIWDSVANSWIGSPTYYAVGDNTAATPPFPQAPITYIDYQSDITSVGNILNLVLNTLSTTRTPYVLLASGGAATIAPAVLNISFYNSGSAAGTITVNGVTVAIPAGVTFNYDAGGNGNKYPANAFGYNATGTTIYVTYTA